MTITNRRTALGTFGSLVGLGLTGTIPLVPTEAKKRKKKGKAKLVKTVTKRAAKAGPVSLKIKPTKAGKKLLKKKGKFSVRLSVTDAPEDEVLDYYEGRLRAERGWRVRRGDANVVGAKGDSYYLVRYEDYEVPGGRPVTLFFSA